MFFDNYINKSTSSVSYAHFTMKRTAVYPGSFDPITNGHIDIIDRALDIFDKVIITVLHNPAKKPLFTVEERIEMIKQSLNGKKSVLIDSLFFIDFLRRI